MRNLPCPLFGKEGDLLGEVIDEQGGEFPLFWVAMCKSF